MINFKKKSYFLLSFIFLLISCGKSGSLTIDESLLNGSTSTSAPVVAPVSTATVAITTPASDGENAGWLKHFSGTCSENGTNVVLSTGAVSSSVACGAGAWEIYLDISTLATGAHTVTASHADGDGVDATATRSITKFSANCDNSVNRGNAYGANLAGGDGSTATPFIICTPNQLAEVANGVATDNYSLENDIYFNYLDTNGDGTVSGAGDTDYTAGTGWTPITIGGFYGGDFNGNSFTIYNLTINDAGVSRKGLFREGMLSFHLHDINIYDASVVAGERSGIIIGGSTDNRVKLTNVNVTGSLTGERYIGAVLGNGTIIAINVNSQASVTGTREVGGFVGGANGGSYFHRVRVYGAGDITGTDVGGNVGGIVGTAGNITLYQVLNEKNVTATQFVGGMAGNAREGSRFFGVGNSGNITGSSGVVGGLIGLGGNSYIDSSFNSGTINGTTGGRAGGLVAGASQGPITITNSISAGRVEGSGAGEILANNTGNLTASNNWFYSTLGCDSDTSTGGDQACNGAGVAGTRATLSDFYSSGLEPVASWDTIGESVNGDNDFFEVTGTSFPISWEVNNSGSCTTTLTGAGTQATPYQISSVAEWNLIGSDPCLMTSYFQVTGNIDFTAQTFTPIGAEGIAFRGSLDGGNFTLSNISLTQTDRPQLGVVSHLAGGSIENLNLTGLNLSGFRLVGGLAGNVGMSTITNSSVSGSVTASSERLGGLVGEMRESTISTSFASVTLNGTGYIGGIVGSQGFSNISQSYSSGSITGTEFLGGISGNASMGATGDYTYANVYSRMTVTGTGDNVGGLFGYQSGAVIDNAYASGNVTGVNYVGGVIGRSNGSITIRNSFSTGDVSGTTNMGYFTGNVTGTFTNNYYNAAATCAGCNTLGTAGSQANATIFQDPDQQPMDRSGAANWDFTTIWQDNSGGGSLPTFQ